MKRLEDIRFGIDIGHGTDTKGKSFLDFNEHNFNSKIAIKLIKELKKLGFKDENIVMAQQPHSEEVELPDRYDQYDNIDGYISIHADAFSNNKADGMTIFHWQNSRGGLKLAQVFKSEFLESGIDIDFRNIVESQLGHWTNFGILREPKSAGLLIEHGFMTNAHDRNEMDKDSVQDKFAKAWAKAIVKYLSIQGILDLTKLKGEDNMVNAMGNERIDIKIKTSGLVIKDLERKTIDKLGIYLDPYEIYVDKPVEKVYYKYVGYNLRKGMYNDTNNAILQKALRELGYYKMEIDNHFGNGTHSAVINLEIDNNLDVTGIVTEKVANKINELLKKKAEGVVDEKDEETKENDNSDFVNFKPMVKLKKQFGYYTKFGQTKVVQSALNIISKDLNLGIKLDEDGHFGRGSQSGLNTYKKFKGLPQDGQVDELTWKWIHYDLEKAQEFDDVKINWYDNQTKIMRVKKDEVDLDVIMGRQPSQSLPSLYRELEEKPLLLTNGGLFGMANGVTLSLLKDEGEEVTFGHYSKWALSQDYAGKIEVRGMYWFKQVDEYKNIKEAIGASPTLVIRGEKNVDKRGLDHGFLNYRHPRIVHGYDDEYIYVIVVHGRNSLKGYVGANIDELVDICLELELVDAINLDGGGSVAVYDKNGKRLDDNTSIRRVDNMVAYYKK